MGGGQINEQYETLEYRDFLIRKITISSDFGKDVFFHAEYKRDSEWHNEFLIGTLGTVHKWIDEQHESEDFQEWEKEILTNQNF